MGVGLGIGFAIGAAFGMALENLGAGIGIGVAIGTGIGTSLEQRNQGNLRPLTEQEKARQKQNIALGLVFTALLGVLLVIVYFLSQMR